jgi:hypothetical protein
MLATDVYLGAWLLSEGAVLKGVRESRSRARTAGPRRSSNSTAPRSTSTPPGFIGKKLK